MKNLLVVILLIFSFAFVSSAQEAKQQTQQPATAQKPEKVDVDAVFSARVILAESEIEKAKKDLEIAKQRKEILELSLRLILNVPNDFVLQVDERGNLFFAKPKKEKE